VTIESILHKEWCKKIFISRSLETCPVFRATIKPAYQSRFSQSRIEFWLAWSFLFAMVSSSRRGDLQQSAFLSTRRIRRCGQAVAVADVSVGLIFGPVRSFQIKNTWRKSKKD
jgi:hypothetical protein